MDWCPMGRLQGQVGGLVCRHQTGTPLGDWLPVIDFPAVAHAKDEDDESLSLIS